MSDRITHPSLPSAAASERVPERARDLRFSVGDLEDRLLDEIDGRRSLEDIANVLGLSAPEVLSMASSLEQLGAVRWSQVDALEGEEERVTAPDLTFDRPTRPG